MKREVGMLFLLAFWVSPSMASSKPLVLARKGQTEYVIVIGETCSASERHAALEMRRFMQRKAETE